MGIWASLSTTVLLISTKVDLHLDSAFKEEDNAGAVSQSNLRLFEKCSSRPDQKLAAERSQEHTDLFDLRKKNQEVTE